MASKTVQTDTSYNGSFLTVDLNTDYKQKQIDAEKAGDYASAAQYEALRNAKINYLNSVGQNTGGWETSNEHTKVYTQSNGKNGAGTNNQGGVVYTDNNTPLNQMKDNWKTTKLNGVTYSRDNDGKYYANGYYKGDGYNSATNEFTFSNQEEARKHAYDQYLGSGGWSDIGGYGVKDVYKYLQDKGIVDEQYVNAVQSGTTGQYTAEQMAKVQAEQKAKQAAAMLQDTNEHSFEADTKTDATITPTPTPTPTPSAIDAYLEAKRKQAHRGNMIFQ